MLKICKNMQNIQNMHSCFKNAALCAPGYPRVPPESTGAPRGTSGNPKGTPKQPPSNPQGTPRKPLETYGTQKNPTSLKSFIARQPYKNVHLHLLHLPPYSPPWSAKLKLSALKNGPFFRFAPTRFSLCIKKNNITSSKQ